MTAGDEREFSVLRVGNREIDSVDICSVDKIISRNILYDSASIEYKKIASGISSIRIQSYKDSTIY